MPNPVNRKNPLDLNIEEVNAPVYVNLDPSFEPDLFFDGRRFIVHLIKTYYIFDVATYSHTESPLRMRRLITGLHVPKRSSLRFLEYKHVVNNHSKIFLCYESPHSVEPKAVYVGSYNLTNPTNFNITYKVRDEHINPVFDFFNQMWKAKRT